MIIEKKGINGFSTNNNRRLHLKMQARGVKHNRTLSVLRQQRKGRGVTMVSTNNNKKSSWKQVRRSDQLRYPIHNRSFIAHGRLWMPCAPASTIKDKKPRLLSIRTCWLCVFGTDCDTHTHTPQKSKILINDAKFGRHCFMTLYLLWGRCFLFLCWCLTIVQLGENGQSHHAQHQRDGKQTTILTKKTYTSKTRDVDMIDYEANLAHVQTTSIR